MLARRLLPLAALLAAGCARQPRIIAVPVTPADATVLPAVDTMRVHRVPAFRAEPLVAWGALPPGEPRAERARTYDLQHQIVRVRFDWERRAVVGSTTLRVAALDQPITTVPLDAVGMTIKRVTTERGNGRVRYDYDGRTLTVKLPGTLRPGARTSFVVEYEAVRPAKGAYFVDRRRVVWTQGETEDTRYWVPTYDFPNDRTTWEIHIRTAKGERALSNGRLQGGVPAPVGDELEWRWVMDEPNATYLMSAVVGNYVVLQDTWRKVPLGYWTYPDSVEAARRGLGATPRMMELFSTRTGVDYPYDKYDQAVAPDYIFGGMENVTATTMADDAILHPAWAEPQANAEDLVAHELGHQWYGNLVTTRNWAHIWLNEGFATFMEQLWAEEGKSRDEGALARLAAQDETIAADRRARRPLVYDRWVTDPLELFLSGHIYPKGATVLQMLRRELGDSTFWRAMRHYTTRHANKSVVTADLQQSLETVTQRKWDRFFAQWIHGAGFPVFRVSYDYDTTARQLSLRAVQVQPRDSLTGLFDADVEVEVLTDSGPVRRTVAVRGETTEVQFPLPAAPRSIRWDKGNWLLDIADFPRPTVMLAHQLERDDDVLGRIEAVSLLAERGDEPQAVTAVARAARADAVWAVRERAAAALAGFAKSDAARAALLAATRDDDPRVRQRAAGALAAFPDSTVTARLRELGADPSLYVRGAAIVSLATLEPAGAMPAIRAMLGEESWLDLTRTQAVRALGRIDTPEAWSLLRERLAEGTSRRTRTEAIASLAARAAGREAELAAALEPLLGAADLYVRQATVRALGRLGQPSSVAALEARRAVEPEGRVVTAIDAALAALRRR